MLNRLFLFISFLNQVCMISLSLSLSLVSNRDSSCSETQCNQVNTKPSKPKCKTTACTLQSLFTEYFGKKKLQPS